MPPKKKKAAQAAQAASKKKSSAIDISRTHEDRVRFALKDLSFLTLPPTVPPSPLTAPLSVQQITSTYLAMQRMGFQPTQIEGAIEQLPLASLSEEAALEWLLLHSEPRDLPKSLAGQGGRGVGAGEVDVRLHALGGSGAGEGREGEGSDGEGGLLLLEQAAKEEEEEEQARREAQEQALREAEAEAARRQAEEEERREKASRRLWILQYAENSDSSDKEGWWEGSDASSVVEEWEVWGDPREVERRRAERKRQQIPRQQRIQLIAQELQQAKEEASKAKAARDKERQRAWGGIIRQLKQEMEQLGITETDLYPPDPPTEHSQDQGTPRTEGPHLSWGDTSMPTLFEEGEEGSAWEGAAAVHPAVPSTPGCQQEEGDGGKEEGGSGSDSEGFTAAGDLFDDAFVSALEPSEGGTKRRAPLPVAPLQPWGAPRAGGGKKGGKKGGKGGASAAKAVEVQQPKAVLQQYCQRQGWAAPRYERLAQGGMRLEGVGYRYSVSVEQGAGRGPRRKAQQAQQGPRCFQLREADDGWERIEDAQSAAATRALFDFGAELPPGGPLSGPVWQVLPPVFQGLWGQWEGEGGEEEEDASEAEADEAARLAFAERLVSAQAAELATEGAAGRAAPAAGGADGGQEGQQEALGWAEQLRQELAAGVQRDAQQAQHEGEAMARELQDWRGSGEGKRWKEERDRLPVADIRDGLAQALAESDVVVVSGETGSGKTTQVPQYILEQAIQEGQGGSCSIVCTQPRRIAAISVAERVATERGEPPPGQRGSRVGYHVRLDAATTPSTRLLFCTTGILLRRMAGNPSLRGVSHVVVDEVHERTLQGDFLLALLRKLVAVRRAAGHPLKVVLMSATLDASLFADYFGGGGATPSGGCPVLQAQGRTFPVEQLFLEDVYEATGYRLAADSPAALRAVWDAKAQRRAAKTAGASKQALVQGGWGDAEADAGVLNPHFQEEMYLQYSEATQRNLARVDEDRIDYDLLEDLIVHIDQEQEEGAILVFLPGMGEITSLYERLAGSRRFRQGGHWLLPLHSSVSPADQRKAFQRPPPQVRKIVLATNIAETSLTIEDVVYVVDSGKLKERRYDAGRGMSLLVEDWVAAAAAKQRRGRAGRVRAGVCYGLYTRHRLEHRMKRYQAPEMVRVPLEELVLQIHLLRLGRAAPFLGQVLQPPPEKSVVGAVRTLQEVGALTPDEDLTPLGHHLAQLPVDPRVGKLLLLSTSLGCLSPALTLAACLSYKSPFSTSFAQQDTADRARKALAAPGAGGLAAGQQSDHLLMVAAVEGWVAARRAQGPKGGREYSRKHSLSEATLDMLVDMRHQFGSMLADIGFIDARAGGGKKGGGWVDDPSAPWNRYASFPAVLKAVLFAALYPNLAVMDHESAPVARLGAGQRPGWHDGSGEVHIHPSSLNHMLETQQFQRPYLTFLEKVKTSRTFLRECTTISPMAILLFGGALRVAYQEGYVTVDEWVRIRVPAQAAVLVKRLRGALEGLLGEKVKRPGVKLEELGGQVLQSIVDLLNHEEAAQQWK